MSKIQASTTTTTTVPSPAGLKPGWRLAPARFGKPGYQADAWVQCPDWCSENHTEQWTQHPIDLAHWGDSGGGWSTDSIEAPRDRLLSLDARLYLDPAHEDRRMASAIVSMDDESTTVYLTPEMAENTADELIAFAARLRHLARQARDFNGQAEESTRSQVDKGLRRVQNTAA